MTEPAAPRRDATATILRDDIDGLLKAARALAAELAAAPAAVERDGDPSPLPSDAATLARLTASVVRPLTEAVDLAGTSSSAMDAPSPAITADPPAPVGGVAPIAGTLSERIWELARRSTTLRTRHPDAPPQLQEATAALQDLACGVTATDVLTDRVAELTRIQAALPAAIRVQTDGPYLVTNVAHLRDWLGVDLPTRPQMALCRCGRSAIKPLCDGTHAATGFAGGKDPKRVPDRLDTYMGLQVTVLDNRGICQHSGLCTDRLAGVFHAGSEPFVTPSGGRMDEIIQAVRGCPSGALGYAIDGREAREQVDFGGQRDATVEITRDGPYRITGGIPLIDGGSDAEPRAQGASLEHYALCRCGHSQNKPFCSGMHWYVDFHDPVTDPERVPTMFEWCGGLPALTRMTSVFYAKYVPADPLLGPVFANMSPDHPERVARWLGEVFGGPRLYSEAYGGYPRMLSQHLGRGITEEWRARWVTLLCAAAHDAGLPADAEFRSAFSAYIEWGSRLAVENSQPGARPPEHMPMPHWDWNTAAGPPGSRISPLAPAEPEAAPAALPDADQPVGFEEHVKPLFRDRDRSSMRFLLDLWSYPDVHANADSILERLRDGSMPCDGAWPTDRVAVFQRWVDEGRRRTAAGAPAAPTPPLPSTAPADVDGRPIEGRLGSLVTLRSTAPLEEPRIVIEHREPLIYMLCAAAELEHMLMCEYLFAAFTLKRSLDEGLTEPQLAAVERWRGVLLAVAKQEMLHLAINCNLVASLGASPHLSRPNLPQPARHYPSGVRLLLLPFGEQALRHFLFLERPEGIDLEDAEGLDAVESASPVMGDDEIAPHLQEFATVGHLYRSIEAGFLHLAEKWGEERLFLVPPEQQTGGELFGWRHLKPITSCADAIASIEEIVSEGEGPRGDWRNAHFGRFLAVLEEYRAMLDANPGLDVARPVLPALVRAPETGELVDLITDPFTARVADLGNVAYEVLLQLLYRLLSRVDESDAQITVLADVGVAMMFDVIEPLADILTTLPVGPEHPGRTAGPSFELFYQPDYLLPHRRAAWLLMAEHLAEAADLAHDQAGREPRLLSVETALRAHAEALRAGAADPVPPR